MVASSVDKDTVSANPYRVMVVDDSAIIRGFLTRYLSDDPAVAVVTTANNGKIALNQLERHDIEVVVLDIEMPEMDGMTALPLMLEKKPGLQVVMASTLTRKNADISMRALSIGAVDYVPKPETARSVNASIDFRRELVEKVKAWAARGRKKRGESLPLADDPMRQPQSAPLPTSDRLQAGFVSARRPAAPTVQTTARSDSAASPAGFVRPTRPEVPAVARVHTAASATPAVAASSNIQLRPDTRVKPKILAIGSSTGGPQALMRFFARFSEPPSVPVVLTQHMPATFTAILAEHLRQATGWPISEALPGQALKAGHVYVAPGGKHLEVLEEGGQLVTHLSDAPPENFCKPAVDPMLRSLIPLFKDRVLVVILTGMGHDGLKGSRDLVREGSVVYAQDEASSVVWGMPGAVSTAGLCSAVLPLDDLGTKVFERLKRDF